MKKDNQRRIDKEDKLFKIKILFNKHEINKGLCSQLYQKLFYSSGTLRIFGNMKIKKN